MPSDHHLDIGEWVTISGSLQELATRLVQQVVAKIVRRGGHSRFCADCGRTLQPLGLIRQGQRDLRKACW